MNLKTLLRSAAQPDVADTPSLRDRLAVAHDNFNANLSSMNAIDASAATIENGAQPAAGAAGVAQSLRQARGNIFARMLQAGRVDTNTPEVVDLDAQLKTAESTERSSAAVLAEKQALILDLHEQKRALAAKIPALNQELLEAQFEAAAVEIEQQLIPALRSAASQLGAAYAALVGGGLAHTELAVQLSQQYGVARQPFGGVHPIRIIDLYPTGFGISDTGNFNTLRIDAGPGIDAAHVDALKRWRAA
ncbi:MAG: hypothetical protein ABI645_00475 [Pseudomonadota bacterium]